MSPTGPLYPGTAADGGGGGTTWTTPNNAKVEDTAVASCLNIGPGGGGGTPNQLNVTNFGFSIPTTAIIDGIKAEIKVQTTGGSNASDSGSVYLLYNGGNTNATNTPNPAQFWPVASLTWLTHGSSTSLWGRTWTPAEVNNANFGLSLSAFPPTGTSTINVDSVRLTVYWHTSPAEVPTRHIYKVFDGFTGTYLGNLPNVKTEFTPSQDINTSGSQITVICGVSADTSRLPINILTDESSNNLTDESNNLLTDEGVAPIVGKGVDINSTALIRNGNAVQVWQYSYYYPNGKQMFTGLIENWGATYGGNADEGIAVLLYNDGADLDNYYIRGNPYTYTGDVTQTSQNSVATISQTSGKGTSWNFYGQTWKVGAGITNLGAISLLLDGTANVTIDIWDSPSLTTHMGSVTQFVSVSAAEVQFGFPASIVTVPASTLFYAVSVDAGQSINIYYSNANPYSNGQMYNSNFGGGSGGGSWGAVTGSDLYFKTFSGTGSTIGTFTAVDPTTGILETFMNDYNARGGLITYNASSIDATGLSLNYGFNSNTILEGLGSVLSMSPTGFYYYVDQGTRVLYFKKASLTADIVLTKGRHLENISIVATIEPVKNVASLSGGLVAGSNLYYTRNDTGSMALYRPRLDRLSDNRVTDTTTAATITQNEVDKLKDEKYMSVVTVIDRTMDITLLKPGMTVGFNGFGTLVDTIITQIVRVDFSSEAATLTLGVLPIRQSIEIEQTIRGLTAQQTIANPSTPS